ncbi:integral membrane protein DUF92-domain-containing protein [Melanogaster broomeanus]|nr:integral membrane protein DUF92-domain-containing protein [Melanogaster broomeanus]
MSWTTLPIFPFIFATLLSVNGAKSRKLSPSGAATAFVVGFLIMAASVRALGISLVVFYFVGSRATKYGKKRKAQLEAGFHDAGYRTGWQVLCNTFPAFVASIVWSVRFTPDSVPWSFLAHAVNVPRGPIYTSDTWCPLSPTISDGLSRALIFATLGQFACCLGDTLASELGILSSSLPILITTLKTVPPGTNGGISVGGTLASIIGGGVVGLTQFTSLALENRVCKAEWSNLLPSLIGWGMAAGVFGSLLDSLLGATLQRTRYSIDKKRILQDASVPANDESVKVISGLNLLTNNQVNLISSMVTALVVARLA